jgi:hypothetical protein
VALEVDGDDRVPLLLGHVEEHAVAQNSGVVDEDVQPAVTVERAADDLLRRLEARDVVVARDRLAARGDDLVHDLLGRSRVGSLARERAAEVVDDHARARARECKRMLAADPAARTGDDRDLAFERGHAA